MPRKRKYCSELFSALANRLRIKILMELILEPMGVNELSRRVNAERTLVSHNLSILSKVDLVEYSTKGNMHIYHANDEMVPYLFYMMEDMVCEDCEIKKVTKELRKRNVKGEIRHKRTKCLYCG